MTQTIERLLRNVYGRDESFQLLLTFALVLMFQDVLRFVWGANPRALDSTYLIYGTLRAGDSFYFESKTPHSWHNPGKKEAVILWINTPPTF